MAKVTSKVDISLIDLNEVWVLRYKTYSNWGGEPFEGCLRPVYFVEGVNWDDGARAFRA